MPQDIAENLPSLDDLDFSEPQNVPTTSALMPPQSNPNLSAAPSLETLTEQ